MTRTKVIEHNKIDLVLLEERDIPFLLSLINDKELTRNLSFRYPMTEEQEREWVNNLYSQASPRQLVFGIRPNSNSGFIEKESDEIIGTVGLSDIDTINARAQTEIMVALNRQGNGYGSDAYRAILRYAFYELNLERVKAHIKSFNEASVHFHNMLGFYHQATLPYWYKEGSAYYHDYIYVLERGDFEQMMKNQEA